MRICQILGGNEEGGLEIHFETLCNRLSTLHEVHVIAHEKYRNRFDRSVVFHSLDLSKGRRNPLLLYMLWQTIRRIDPDIVHAHANKAAAMVASLRYVLPSDSKCVATLHSQKKNLKAFEKFDHVIGVSKTVVEPLKLSEKSVVYNGIDIPDVRYDPAYLGSLGINADTFVICAVGRMEKVKNFALLLHAIKDLDVALLLVGEGSQKESLQTLAEELQIEKKVCFTGFRDDVPKLLFHSDLCVISSDREGFSYVMAEALLLETPVVSTDVGDMRYVLPRQYVVPVGDEAALREGIVSVMRDKEETMKIFEPYFSFAKRDFTLESMIRGVLSVYDEVLQR